MLDALVQGAEGDQPRIAGGIQRHRHLRHFGERGGEFQRIGQQVPGGNREQVGARRQAGPARLDGGHDHRRQQPCELAQSECGFGGCRRGGTLECGKDLFHRRVGGTFQRVGVDQRPGEF